MPTLIIKLKRNGETVTTVTRATKKAALEYARAAFPKATYRYEWEA